MKQSIINLSEGALRFKIAFEAPSLENNLSYGFTRANSHSEAVKKFLLYIKDCGYKDVKIVSATLEN